MDVEGNKERSESRQEMLRLGNGAIHAPITQLCMTQREEGEEGLEHWWDIRGWGWVGEWGRTVTMVDVASTNQELQPAWRPWKSFLKEGVFEPKLILPQKLDRSSLALFSGANASIAHCFIELKKDFPSFCFCLCPLRWFCPNNLNWIADLFELFSLCNCKIKDN